MCENIQEGKLHFAVGLEGEYSVEKKKKVVFSPEYNLSHK